MPAVPASRIRYRRLVRKARSPIWCAGRACPVPVDLPAGEVGYLARRLLRLALHLDLIAGRLRHPAAQVDHRSGGHRTEAEQDPPRQIVAHSGTQQRQRDQRSDDEPERLGREHHPDQLAAVLPVGVLAHQHRADRIVTADAEAEQEAERDQHPVRGRQRRPQRAHDHDRGDHPVHALTAGHIGEAPEHERAEEGGGQHRAVEQGEPARTQVPLRGDQRGGDPDDEQVVGVGEKPHPRNDHRAQMKSAQRRLIERGDQVPGTSLSHGIPPAVKCRLARASRPPRSFSCDRKYSAETTCYRPVDEHHVNAGWSAAQLPPKPNRRHRDPGAPARRENEITAQLACN